MYLKLTNGIPEKYSIGMLRRDNPNTSFPKSPPNELLASWDVYSYTVLDKPTYDSLTQKLSEGSFEQDADGNWTLGWTVENYEQAKAEENVRQKRNVLLKSSDWTQVADAPVDKTAWATYRQELRDITSQTGFPFSVTWPTQPE